MKLPHTATELEMPRKQTDKTESKPPARRYQVAFTLPEDFYLLVEKLAKARGLEMGPFVRMVLFQNVKNYHLDDEEG